MVLYLISGLLSYTHIPYANKLLMALKALDYGNKALYLYTEYILLRKAYTFLTSLRGYK